MKKLTIKFVSVVGMLLGSSMASATSCYVVGQDPKNPDNYNQLIKYFDNLVFSESTQIMIKVGDTVVSYSKNSEGDLGVGLSSSSEPKLYTYASGGADKVQLIDASKALTIFCK